MTTLHNDKITVSVRSLGAELVSIKSKEGREYLWQGDPTYWPKQSPLLFPIVGNLPGKEYTHQGKTYSMGNHGFIAGRDFTLVSSSETELILEFKSDAISREIYPFDFALQISYTLVGNSLKIGYKVENLGSENLPFSIGAHPGFRAPLDDGESREDYDLIFEKSETIDRHFINLENTASGETELFLNAQKQIPVSNDLFSRGAIVLKDHVSRKVTLKSRKSGHYVEISFPDFPYIGIWSPRDLSPFVCLEPWFGVIPHVNSSKELSTKEGIQTLTAGATFRSEYQISVG